MVIDAGHGSRGNEGNHGCACQLEQEHTLSVAQHVALQLQASGRFEVQLSRHSGETPSYRTRIAAAERFRAEIIVSIHSDARGWPTSHLIKGDEVCWANPDDPGFAVLWNDEGEARFGRQHLGRVMGRRLREAGFLPYDGYHYSSLYEHDTEEPSAWIDRRPIRKRVYFLRASTIPTVIIETHHALDSAEVARWDEATTVSAFSSAVGAAVLEAVSNQPSPRGRARSRE